MKTDIKKINKKIKKTLRSVYSLHLETNVGIFYFNGIISPSSTKRIPCCGLFFEYKSNKLLFEYKFLFFETKTWLLSSIFIQTYVTLI